MKTWSPLRYPGGKGKMYKQVLQIIEKNNLIGCTYIEPFAGGAGIAIRLLLEEKVEKIIINDLDRSIYAFWYILLNDTKRFVNDIKDIEVNIDNWQFYKEVQKTKETADLYTLGFSTFFLNRTNRSGIINAGPIGGKMQNGNYKINCRFNKDNLIKLITLIAEKKEKITLLNYDAIKIFDKYDHKNYLYFIDPPYYIKGSELYQNFLKHEDHLKLSKAIIKNLKDSKYIITYDNADAIIDMYKDLDPSINEISYSLQNKVKTNELIIFSKNIK